jgi:hypothetical protein
MRRMRWALYLWPGVPQLTRHGSWSALAIALGLGLLLNMVLIGTLGWSELFSPGVRNAVWLGLAVVWLAALAFCAGDRGPTARQAVGDHFFCEALDYYLKGNWFEAERALGQVLAVNQRDLDARLMLATLLRHTGRLDEAAEELERIGRCEGSQKWEPEIARERQLLAESRHQRSEEAVAAVDFRPVPQQPNSQLEHAA